ncbi:FAD binding domain-containing protein [Fusarium oxysporum]|nr:FAD binding domain-containing protein [Fusarium oxysporum]
MVSPPHSVVITGAGPVGLFTALLLAKSGIKVSVYETRSGIETSPRAVAYFPAVLEEFSKVGALEAVVTAGEKNNEGCDWRDKDGNIIYGLEPPRDDSHFVVMLSQPELCQVILEAIEATGNARVHFRHTFQRLQQGSRFVDYWIKNENDGSETKSRCLYLVGADGGRSTIRRSLGVQLEGHTWEDMLFVAVNFQYHLENHGWKGANFIIDPEEWCIIVKRGKGSSWRMATGIRKDSASKVNTLDEATIKRIKDRLAHLLPGDTSKIEYEAMAPYIVHQRCATEFVQGNVILARDAAHTLLNNPVGGLGLTTGLLDAAHLGVSLRRILNEGASTELLDVYNNARRRVFRERTDPISTANLLRLMSDKPEDNKKRAEFFKRLHDPNDLSFKLQGGLPDFALTTTSNTKFDTCHEVTWFISVTRIEDWTIEKFKHEYKTVHAGMTKKGKEQGSPLRRYIQLSNSDLTMPDAHQPHWDYVTCLTFPNLFVTHAGFQDPGYRARAGAHIFCRLDQQGCLAKQVTKYSKSIHDQDYQNYVIRALVFHDRRADIDEYSREWLAKRGKSQSKIAAADENVLKYILWEDHTPKNSDAFFANTQFSGRSWHKYKAVEAFDFTSRDIAAAFLSKHHKTLN